MQWGKSDTQVTLKLLKYINLLQLNVAKGSYFLSDITAYMTLAVEFLVWTLTIL